MIKNIAIVSLSRGVAGEAFAQHEVEIGLKRLAGYGVNVQLPCAASTTLPHTQRRGPLTCCRRSATRRLI